MRDLPASLLLALRSSGSAKGHIKVRARIITIQVRASGHAGSQSSRLLYNGCMLDRANWLKMISVSFEIDWRVRAFFVPPCKSGRNKSHAALKTPLREQFDTITP